MKHLYANDTTDWYVAESVEHAVKLYRDLNAITGLLSDEEMDTAFAQVDDDKKLTRTEDDGSKITKTAREWAYSNEPGFLMTTEY